LTPGKKINEESKALRQAVMARNFLKSRTSIVMPVLLLLFAVVLQGCAEPAPRIEPTALSSINRLAQIKWIWSA